MSKIKKENGKYFAFAEYNEKWYPFWHKDEIPKDIRNSMSVGVEYTIDKEVQFGNCGTAFYYPNATRPTPCSGLWPNSSCPNCGGYGVGASFVKN